MILYRNLPGLCVPVLCVYLSSKADVVCVRFGWGPCFFLEGVLASVPSLRPLFLAFFLVRLLHVHPFAPLRVYHCTYRDLDHRIE